jgi:choline-sulfatase
VVIFTADHGDMLGERGLWYKMSFFEWAARVPLIIAAPERFAPGHPGRVEQNVSLLDLYPSLVELAGAEAPEPAETVPAEPLGGRSLLPLMDGRSEGWPDTVLGEYLGEGAAGPLVMVRRGAHKYVAGEASPPQLFDLGRDPQELTDLAGEPAQGALARAFAEAVAARWDLEALRRQVIASQRRRRLVFDALARGRHQPWDHQPHVDAAGVYARNTGQILGDRERLARLPPVAPVAPDAPD